MSAATGYRRERGRHRIRRRLEAHQVIMQLYMIELAVADWSSATAWYRDVLGLRVLLRVEADRFALLGAGETRLALKEGTPDRGRPGDGVLLVFEVGDLDAELARLALLGVTPEAPPRQSPEGYRRAIIRDPDGQRLCLFDWGPKKS